MHQVGFYYINFPQNSLLITILCHQKTRSVQFVCIDFNNAVGGGGGRSQNNKS